MSFNPTNLRPLLLGTMILALASASGCSWFKHKSNYAQSPENQPLEVPPGLDLPNTSDATPLPPASGLGGNSTTGGTTGAGFVVSGKATELFPRVGVALEGIDGVSIVGRAEALSSYDVKYQGQDFLLRVQDTTSGSRILALSADGQVLSTGPAAQLLDTLKSKLK